MFQMTSQAIDSRVLRTQLQRAEVGGIVFFEGTVRNHNEGRKVEKLAYEAYEQLALSEGQKILAEAQVQFEIKASLAIHRIGELAIGDTAVWVGAAAAHRDAAFRACRFIIDEIKKRLPIWKKEFYVDAPAEWVECQHCFHDHNTIYPRWEDEYYSRQNRLQEVGTVGQDRLKQARVAVIGAGGLGCPALTYLATAGIGKIVIIDHDRIDRTNLHRQPFFHFQDVGLFKARIAAERLTALNPFIDVQYAIERLSSDNAERLLGQVDVIVDCSDNFATKFLLNDFAVLFEKTLIQASIYQFEGQLQVISPSRAGCLRCLWPDIPDPRCVGTCAQVGVLGALPGVLGSMQAMETIKVLLNGPVCDDGILTIDLWQNRQSYLKRTRNRRCPVCGDTPRIRRLEAGEYATPGSPWTLQVTSKQMAEAEGLILVDVREFEERDPKDIVQQTMLHYPKAEHHQLRTLAPECKYLLVCQSGLRSHRLAEQLWREGKNNFFSLADGIQMLRTGSACHDHPERGP